MIPHIQFGQPWLLTLVPVAIFAVVGLFALLFATKKKSRSDYGDQELVNKYSSPWRRSGYLSAMVATAIGAALVVVAMAGPTQQDAPTKVKAGSLQVIAMMDVSLSMAAEDYRNDLPACANMPKTMGPCGSRLDLAKYAILNQIVPAIPGNELGLVTYSGGGFVQLPLTSDLTMVEWVIKDADYIRSPGGPGGGSHLDLGLPKALEAFKIKTQVDKDHGIDDSHKQRMIILFTDGGFDGCSSKLQDTLQVLKKENIQLVVVGVGSDTDSVLPHYDPLTNQFLNYYAKVDSKQGDPCADPNSDTSGAAGGGGGGDGAGDDSAQKAVSIAFDPTFLRNQVAGPLQAKYIRLTPNGKLDVKWATELADTRVEKQTKNLFRIPLGLAVVAFFIAILPFGRGKSTKQ